MELAVNMADTGGTIELRIDDQVVISETNIDTNPTGGFDRTIAGIGFAGAVQTGPAAMYIDDLVVDVVPIGCVP